MRSYRLSPEAAHDLVYLLAESRRLWGDAVARRTKARLESRFEGIATGREIGHRCADIPPDLPLLFIHEPPFVVAFDAETRRIVRVIHGRRDLPRLFPSESDDTP